ncbi:MAG: hypothetical protein V4616_00265 [Bacteroidota bacterium]
MKLFTTILLIFACGTLAAQVQRAEIFLNSKDCIGCTAYFNQLKDSLDRHDVPQEYSISGLKPFEVEFYLSNYSMNVPAEKIKLVGTDRIGSSSFVKLITRDSTYTFGLIEYPSKVLIINSLIHPEK